MRFNFSTMRPLLLQLLKKIWMLLFVLTVIFGGNAPESYAKNTDQDLRVKYQDNKLSVVAQDVDIKRILSKIAERANIRISFPPDMKRSVTLERVDASIKAVLRNLLIGWNHVVIYSRSGQKKAKIAQVIVFSQKKAQPASKAASRNLARIQSYERQLVSLRAKLSKVDADSSRGRQYARRIKMLEQRIERLNR